MTTAITINVMAMTMTTPVPATAPAIIGSVSVSGELGGVVTAHSGSLKDEMWTGQVGSTSRISPSTAIEMPLDTHCWIWLISVDAFVVTVPYSLERKTTWLRWFSEHWNPLTAWSMCPAVNPHWQSCSVLSTTAVMIRFLFSSILSPYKRWVMAWLWSYRVILNELIIAVLTYHPLHTAKVTS